MIKSSKNDGIPKNSATPTISAHIVGGNVMKVYSRVVGEIVLMCSAAGLMTCSAQRRQSSSAGRHDIEAVRMRHETDLMAIQGVVGVASGACGEDMCMIVMVPHFTDVIRRDVPITIEGYGVRLLEVGDIRIDAGQPSDQGVSS